MTSQIILGNFNGIAIASDTASTNTRTNAVSLGVHKIFELGGPHRVVVSIASALWQDGMPQNSALRKWAQTLSEPLVSLADYAASFRSFYQLGSIETPIAASQANIRSALADHYDFLVGRIEGSGVIFADNPEWLEGIGDYESDSVKMTVIEEGIQHLESLSHFEGMSDELALELIEQFEVDVDRSIRNSFNAISLNDEMMLLLRASAPMIVARAQYVPSISTDLHFVGYGASDTTPASIQVANRGTIGNYPMHYVSEPIKVGTADDEWSYLIQTVAQDSAINTFITGLDLNLHGQMKTLFDKQLNKSELFAIVESERDKVDDVWDSVLDSLNQVSFEGHTRWFLDLIRFAPKERLAEIALTLIELQKIRSEASPGINSVGGAVDVVLITATDGVTWVRGQASD